MKDQKNPSFNDKNTQLASKNGCNSHKNRNCTKITFSDEWTFYLESSSVFRWIIKGEEYLN